MFTNVSGAQSAVQTPLRRRGNTSYTNEEWVLCQYPQGIWLYCCPHSVGIRLPQLTDEKPFSKYYPGIIKTESVSYQHVYPPVWLCSCLANSQNSFHFEFTAILFTQFLKSILWTHTEKQQKNRGKQ